MAARPDRLPHGLAALLSLAAFLFGEIGSWLHNRHRRHHCYYTDASTPPSCVYTGRAACNGKG